MNMIVKQKIVQEYTNLKTGEKQYLLLNDDCESLGKQVRSVKLIISNINFK